MGCHICYEEQEELHACGCGCNTMMCDDCTTISHRHVMFDPEEKVWTDTYDEGP